MFFRCYPARLLVVDSLVIGGCTPRTNPLKGWHGITAFVDAPVPDAIRHDAQDWFDSMSSIPKPGHGVDGLITYWEDGTGQHAVVVEAYREGICWRYALIYDRDNRRIRVLKYSTGFHQS